jgi:hypothetical protein
MTLTLPRRAVVDPDELPATVSAPPASPTATDGRSGQPSDPEREWLRKLNWGLFETLVESAFSRDGFVVGPVPQRLDGRADMLLERRGERLLVQCKHWKAWQVGTPAVAELRELVDEEGLDNGLLITAGKFSPEAAALAEDSGLLLLDGDDLLRMAAGGPVLPLADETTSQWALPKGWTAFGAPTCPLCEAPMLYKKVRAGAHTGMRFWGCRNYPTCRAIREVGPAYAGLPLERPAPGVETDEVVAVEDVTAQNDAAEQPAPSLAVVVTADIDKESVDDDADGDASALPQVLPAAPVPVAALPEVPLPVAPLAAADLPARPLPTAPLPTAPLIEYARAEELGDEAEPVDAESVEAVQVDADSVEPAPAAALPSAAPIISDSAADAPIVGEPQVSESSALAPAAILPSAPVPQLLPAPMMAAEEPDLAIAEQASAEPTPAEPPTAEPASAELSAPELPNVASLSVEQPVMPPMALPVEPVAAAEPPAEVLVVPVVPATDAAPRVIPPAPAATGMPPVPTAPVPAAPVAEMPTFPPAAAPIAAAVEAPPPALVAPPNPAVVAATEATVSPPLSPQEAVPAEPVVEVAAHTPPAVAEDAPASPRGWADPQGAEPEVAEPGAIVRRRAELGLPELQLPPGSEDSYRCCWSIPPGPTHVTRTTMCPASSPRSTRPISGRRRPILSTMSAHRSAGRNRPRSRLPRSLQRRPQRHRGGAIT